MNTVVRSRLVGGLGLLLASLAAILLARVVHASFTIDADAVAPISSGRMTPLDVRFTNGYDVPISVTHLQVIVRAVSSPNADATHRCSPDDFVVDQAPGNVEIVIGARTTRSLSSLHVPTASWPQVRIGDGSTDQDACQGASVTLGYTAARTLKIL